MSVPTGREAILHRDDGVALDPRTDADWLDWVGAGGARGWSAGDPILDWLDEYGVLHGFVPDHMRDGYDPRFDLRRFVVERGRRFEEAVLAHLETHARVTRITERGIRSLAAPLATVDAMTRGDEVIAQGVLRDPEHRVYGRVDLLVREDVLFRIWPDARAGEPERFPFFDGTGGRPLYRVIEIKFKGLKLNKDGGLAAAHRGEMVQAWAYGRALGRVQGFAPPAAYVLGRSWEQGDDRGDDGWERLGRVSADRAIGQAALGAIFEEGAAWLRRVKTEGAEWRVLPVPSIPELWPNMRNDGDAPWHKAKREIAEKLGELTLVGRVGPAHRQRAHLSGVTRWDDQRAGAALLGITDTHAPVVDAMLAVNRDRTDPPVRPLRVVADAERWRAPAARECYVDFETVNNLKDDFGAFPRRGGQTLIFQIGCGRWEEDRWRFDQFTVDALTVEAEAVMLDRWIARLRELAAAAGRGIGEVRLFHWSPAETGFLESYYESARQRHPDREWPALDWYDLLAKVVRAQPVVVRGAFGFGLKAVANSLHALGLIETSWADGLADGAGAMAGAWAAEDEASAKGVPLGEIDAMKEIARYNEIDCRTMAEVLRYLRQKH